MSDLRLIQFSALQMREVGERGEKEREKKLCHNEKPKYSNETSSDSQKDGV